MTSSLLSLITDACLELGLPVPSVIDSTGDMQIKQLVALANREGKEVYDKAGGNEGWQALRKFYTITTVADQEAYDIPSDLAYFINGTMFQRGLRWECIGPLTPSQWQILKNGVTNAGPRILYRIMENKIYLNPIPAEDDAEITFEYYSNMWATTSAGTPKEKFTLETDRYRLSDDLMVLGIKWRFLQAKGLDYLEFYNEWQRNCDKAIARDGGGRILQLTRNNDQFLLNERNLPDTGYGV